MVRIRHQDAKGEGSYRRPPQRQVGGLRQERSESLSCGLLKRDVLSVIGKLMFPGQIESKIVFKIEPTAPTRRFSVSSRTCASPHPAARMSLSILYWSVMAVAPVTPPHSDKTFASDFDFVQRLTRKVSSL